MIHMLKSRTAQEVLTRCGQTIKLKSGQSLPDIGVSGSESRITCEGCRLPSRRV